MKIYRTITKFVHFYIRRVYLCARSGNQPLCVGVYVCVNNRFCTICYFFSNAKQRYQWIIIKLITDCRARGPPPLTPPFLQNHGFNGFGPMPEQTL